MGVLSSMFHRPIINKRKDMGCNSIGVERSYVRLKVIVVKSPIICAALDCAVAVDSVAHLDTCVTAGSYNSSSLSVLV